MNGRVYEYLLFVHGEAKFIMYAHTKTKIEDALHILNKHQGQSLTAEAIQMKPRTQVPKRTWEDFKKLQRGGQYHATNS